MMERKPITFYKLESKYSEDITKNCGLVGQELDNNFMNLKEMDIINISRDGLNIVLERVDGSTCSVDLTPILGNATTDFSVAYDSKEGNIIINYNGEQAVIDGLITTDNFTDNALAKVVSDSSLYGDGTKSNPLKISPVHETGIYAPAKALIDLTTEGSTLPSANSLIKGDRYVTRETVDMFGKLYNYAAVQRIASDLALEGKGWRIPTKEDWDGMLNAIEPCTEYQNHDSINGNIQCGKVAGKLLKSNHYWKLYSGSTTTCSTYITDNSICTTSGTTTTPSQKRITPNGVDAYGFGAVPAGYGDGYQLNGYFKERAMFWTSTVSHVSDVYIKRLDYDKATVVQEIVSPNTIASIRLVKDYDGSNHYDTECILGQDYKTVLMPSNTAKNGHIIFTDVNVSFMNCAYCPIEPNGGCGLPIESTYPTYYVNEWDGCKWLKREMQEGEGIVLNEGINGEKNIEYRLTDGELQDVNNEVYNMVIEHYDEKITDLQTQIDDAVCQIQETNNKIQSVETTLNDTVSKLETETADRVKGDRVLSNTIETYYNELTSADTRISSILTDEANERAKQDNLLWNGINGETHERQSADDAIKQTISELSSNTSTTTDSLRADLNTEIQERKNEDINLNAKVDNEVNRATAKDNELDGKISSLEANTKYMINELNTNVSDSIQTLNNNLVQAIETINGGIAAEIQERKDADTELGSRIDALNTKVDEGISSVESGTSQQIQDLNNRLQEEIERAQSAENRISSKVDTEIAERKKADEEIKTSLNNEIKRSTDKDTEIEGKLVTEGTYSCVDGILTLVTSDSANTITIVLDSNYGTF